MNERAELELLTDDMGRDCQGGRLTLDEVRWIARFIEACCLGVWPVQTPPTPPRISGMLNALAYRAISVAPVPAERDPFELLERLIDRIKPHGDDWKGEDPQ